MAIPTADFPEAQFLPKAHKVVVAQVGDVSALDWSKEKVALHIPDVTEEVRQNTPHQKIAVARRHAYLTELEDRQ